MKMLARMSAAACLVVGTLSVGITAAQAADGDGDATAVDVSPPGDQVPADVRAAAATKQAVADAYLRAKKGRGSTADFHAALNGYAGNAQVNVGPALRQTLAGGDTATTLAVSTDKVLSVAQYPQINGYFCGPATGKMILKYLQAGDSAYNGSPQDQEHIGGPDHMDTAAQGATYWSTGKFRVGVNRWREGKIDGYYVNVDTPTVSKWKSSLIFDVDYGFPMAADAVELAGGTHIQRAPGGQADRALDRGAWVLQRRRQHSIRRPGDQHLDRRQCSLHLRHRRLR